MGEKTKIVFQIFEVLLNSESSNLHAGCVIGADGFGFAPGPEGYDKIPQIGIVTIEDDVEIGANTCVDRSTMGSTYVRKGVKLDNLVQIAHNTDIGANTVMSSQVGVAGSTKVGEWCMFGGQVGIAGHITIGDKVFLGAQSGVPGSLKSGQQLIGTPPMEQRAYFKSQAIFRRLPDMYKELNFDKTPFGFDGKKSVPSFDQIGFVWAATNGDSNVKLNFGFNYHRAQISLRFFLLPIISTEHLKPNGLLPRRLTLKNWMRNMVKMQAIRFCIRRQGIPFADWREREFYRLALLQFEFVMLYSFGSQDRILHLC